MTPTSISVSSHKKDNKKKKQDNMRTRKNDVNKRSTSNSEKRVIISDDLIKNKKKKLQSGETRASNIDNNKINKNLIERTEQKIELENKSIIETHEKDSGTSYSENGMESEESGEIEDEKSVHSEPKLNSATLFEKKNEKATTMSDSESSSNLIGKKKQSYSLFPIRIKSALLWYVRNELFQSIKIVGDEHLETDGVILKNALAKVEYDYDSKTQNYHAYVHEVRRLIKQTMCSRRGYVKRKIGVLLRGK
jgi:hypothetical protein